MQFVVYFHNQQHTSMESMVSMSMVMNMSNEEHGEHYHGCVHGGDH